MCSETTADTSKSLIAISKAVDAHLRRDSDLQMLKPGEAGRIFLTSGECYIIFNDSLSIDEICLTVAHELGHLFLEHDTRINDRRIFYGQPICEYEADIFAHGLLKLLEALSTADKRDLLLKKLGA